ncbi:MAG TPA: hypothetical protein VGF91_12910 [Solirubrobacteraceae bacterium]
MDEQAGEHERSERACVPKQRLDIVVFLCDRQRQRESLSDGALFLAQESDEIRLGIEQAFNRTARTGPSGRFHSREIWLAVSLPSSGFHFHRPLRTLVAVLIAARAVWMVPSLACH